MMRPAMSFHSSTYTIIGNGIAGITAAEVLREENTQADIIVIADDPYPVYYRPALKDYLAGRVHEDKLWARPTNFYQQRGIRFLRDRVVAIQVEQRMLEFQSGQRLAYQKLLLAQGAQASRLSCPGVNLKGVVTLRTVADYQWVENCLSQVERIVVAGSGTLALETIETLRHRGFQVTHLLRRHILWSEILDATASDLVLQQEQRDGVEVRQGEEIAEILGQDGWVNGVVTTTGKKLPCELVLIAIGIDPNIDFVKRSGIACGRGITVDAAMRTNAPDIYAAGDVLETTDPLTGRIRVIGQWYPAIQQARAAAYSMLGLLGTARPFLASTFYNASFLYGLDFASVGITTLQPNNRGGYQELVADPQPKSYQKAILQGGVPVGMLALGNRKGVLAYKRAIDHRVNLSPVIDRLFAPTFQLDAWLDKLGVPAPILSVSRANVAVTPPERTAAVIAPQRIENQPTITIPQRIENAAPPPQNMASQAPGPQNMASNAPTRGLFRTPLPAQLPASEAAMATSVLPLADLKRALSSQQPFLTPQAELHLPEATQSLPAAVVLELQTSPALILIREGKPEVFFLGGPGSANRRGDQRLKIGRNGDNDIVLTDIAVSRHHAELVPGPNGFYLHDLKSSNGVLVNQTKITNPYQLTPGDRILIGSFVCYFFGVREAVPLVGDATQGSALICRLCGNKSGDHLAAFCQVCGAPFQQVSQEI